MLVSGRVTFIFQPGWCNSDILLGGWLLLIRWYMNGIVSTPAINDSMTSILLIAEMLPAVDGYQVSQAVTLENSRSLEVTNNL